MNKLLIVELGKILAEIRKQNELKQISFGISQSTISNLENGYLSAVYLTIIEKTLGHYNIYIYELFFIAEQKIKPSIEIEEKILNWINSLDLDYIRELVINNINLKREKILALVNGTDYFYKLDYQKAKEHFLGGLADINLNKPNQVLSRMDVQLVNAYMSSLIQQNSNSFKKKHIPLVHLLLFSVDHYLKLNVRSMIRFKINVLGAFRIIGNKDKCLEILNELEKLFCIITNYGNIIDFLFEKAAACLTFNLECDYDAITKRMSRCIIFTQPELVNFYKKQLTRLKRQIKRKKEKIF